MEKYRYIKAFGSGKPYEEANVHEIQNLLLLDGRLNEVEVECQELNKKWRSQR